MHPAVNPFACHGVDSRTVLRFIYFSLTRFLTIPFFAFSIDSFALSSRLLHLCLQICTSTFSSCKARISFASATASSSLTLSSISRLANQDYNFSGVARTLFCGLFTFLGSNSTSNFSAPASKITTYLRLMLDGGRVSLITSLID